MRRPLRRLTAASLAVVVSSALVACGYGEVNPNDVPPADPGAEARAFTTLSPARIVAAVEVDMGRVASLHVTSDLKTKHGTQASDLDISDSGNCAGEVSTGKVALKLRLINGVAYFQGSRDYLSSLGGAPLADAAGGKWVRTINGAPFAAACQLDNVVQPHINALAEAVVDDVPLVVGDPVARNGEWIVSIKGAGTTWWISASGEHYLVGVDLTGKTKGSLTYKNFDDVDPIEAPTRNVFDLDSYVPPPAA